MQIGTVDKLSRDILNQFQPDMAGLILEFGKYLSKLDADFLVFMARKSLRLYDLLLKVGLPPSERIVLSDRALQQSNLPVRGKRVALIDDTLIVGTTLGDAKRQLQNHGADVTCHVFCVDSQNWCQDLVVPDKIFAELDSQKVMTFCTSEIRALSIVPLPYLVDYPLSTPVRIRGNALNTTLADLEWTAYKISTDRQERCGAYVYSFLPSGQMMSDIEHAIGGPAASVLDIVKVRGFARRVDNVYWFTFVPIVSLRPLSEADVDRLFSRLLTCLQGASAIDSHKLRDHLSSSVCKLRLAQHILGMVIGYMFLRQLNSVISGTIEIGFQEREAIRHYGPWLREEIHLIASTCYQAVCHEEGWLSKTLDGLRPAPLPQQVIATTDRDIRVVSDNRPSAGVTKPRLSPSKNLFTDFSLLFINMYTNHEGPAREEAKKLGKQIYVVPPEQAPHRDRLHYGLSWNSIVERMCEAYKIRLTRGTSALLSLILDHLVDLGIAVPISCTKDGIVFRAYRHGEDVKFADQEMELCYRALEGYLGITKVNSIARLPLEKLLTLLIRVGAGKGFLEVIYGITGTEGIARIGYHLHGAVPMLPRQDDGYFADVRPSWLSEYLLDRGIIKQDPIGRSIGLGTSVEGNQITSGSTTEAKQIGQLYGILTRGLPGYTDPPPPLTYNKQILLATCVSPHDTAAALAAELNVFIKWFDRRARRVLERLQPTGEFTVEQALAMLIGGSTVSDHEEQATNAGYSALHSSRLKYRGFLRGASKSIARECGDYLRGIPVGGDFLADYWGGCCTALFDNVSLHERTVFGPYIDRLARAIFELALYMFSIELGLEGARLQLCGQQTDERFNKVRKKIREYIASMGGSKGQNVALTKLLQRITEIAKNKTLSFNPDEAIKFGCAGLVTLTSRHGVLLRDVQQALSEFQRNAKLHRFNYLVWYDIIDSRGIKQKLVEKRLEHYRGTVDRFRQSVVGESRQLMIRATKRRAQIYAWQGTAWSKNDEKHFFVSGTNALDWVREIMIMLEGRLDAHPAVGVRIIIISCDFAGEQPYKYERDPTVEGKQFWEHLSMVKAKLRGIEDERIRPKPGKSLLFIGGDQLLDRLRIEDSINWRKTEHETIETILDDFAIRTDVAYGEMQPKAV